MEEENKNYIFQFINNWPYKMFSLGISLASEER
jgi:hypothetical protein